MTDMLNLSGNKILILLYPLAKSMLTTTGFEVQTKIQKKLTLAFFNKSVVSELMIPFFYHLTAVMRAICLNHKALPNLLFGMIITLGSLLSTMNSYAQTEFSLILSPHNNSHVSGNIYRINDNSNYRIQMLPNLQKNRIASSMFIKQTDESIDTKTPTTTELIDMDKVELASLQVMHVLNEICPNLLPASQQASFQRAFNARLQEMLPSVSDPQSVIESLSTQRSYRRELNSLKAWINGLSKTDKSILCREIAAATL